MSPRTQISFEIILQKDKKSDDQCYLMLFTCFDKFPSLEDMFLPTCYGIQSFAFQENPGEVALKHYTASCVKHYTASCVIANYFEDAAVLCIGFNHF